MNVTHKPHDCKEATYDYKTFEKYWVFCTQMLIYNSTSHVPGRLF